MFDAAIEKTADVEEVHREAYNLAFYELGLRWHWDADTYRNLQPDSLGASDRIRGYLETHQPHLLKAYDAAFLIGAIQDAKTRCFDAMKGRSCGPTRHIDWAQMQCVQVGV